MLKYINKLLIDVFFNVISNFSASLNSVVNLRDALWAVIVKNCLIGAKISKSFNMICGLNVTHSHSTKIHILVIPLVGSPKPKTKSKNPPTHPGTEKREAKVVILGDFRGGLRVLIRSFQT